MTEAIKVNWPQHYRQEYNDMLARLQACNDPTVLNGLAQQCLFSLYEIMANCAGGDDKVPKENELVVGWNFQTAHGTLSYIHHTLPDGEVHPVYPVS